MSKTEITVAQYKKCVEAKACQAPLAFTYQHKNFAFEHCNGVCDLIGNVSEILSNEVEDTDCNGRSCNQQYYIVGLSWKDQHRDKITILSQIDEGDDQSGFRVVLSMKD